jgi:hypothetical protein
MADQLQDREHSEIVTENPFKTVTFTAIEVTALLNGAHLAFFEWFWLANKH